MMKTGERKIENTKEVVKNLENTLGRKIRIAHVGNIANNAYLAARSQRHLGIDAYCFSPDYVHVMGFPEWEEVSFKRDPEKGAFDPNFEEIFYVRPYWFLSGSWEDIRLKFIELGFIKPSSDQKINFRGVATKYMFAAWKLIRPFARKLVPPRYRAWVVNSVLIKARKVGMTPAQEVLKYFDLIHFYGPYNYMAQLVELHSPFITTEHGTLRDYIFSDYEQARLSKKSYVESKKVLITNQDSLPAALKCGISTENVEFTPHPINEDDFEKLRLNRDKIHLRPPKILVPARQVKPSNIDAGKGNFQMYKAIQECKELGLNVKFQIPLWGDHVEESLALVNKLSIEEYIEWIPLLSRPLLKEYMSKAIAVLDQLNVEAYGAIGADALAIGVPLLTRSGGENDVLAYGNKAPVFDCHDSDSIVSHIKSLLSGNFDFTSHANISQQWFDKYLSNQIATNIAIESYNHVLTHQI